MDLESLRANLPSHTELAKEIDEKSDPIGGIHGLKMILLKSGNYRGKLDGNIEEAGKKKTDQANNNPVVRGLINFQIGYNSPFQLDDDGKPLNVSPMN